MCYFRADCEKSENNTACISNSAATRLPLVGPTRPNLATSCSFQFAAGAWRKVANSFDDVDLKTEFLGQDSGRHPRVHVVPWFVTFYALSEKSSRSATCDLKGHRRRRGGKCRASAENNDPDVGRPVLEQGNTFRS